MKIYDVSMRLSEASEQALWEQALEDDSNQALDWLWLAMRLEGEKRSYSLWRALEIDPLAIARRHR